MEQTFEENFCAIYGCQSGTKEKEETKEAEYLDILANALFDGRAKIRENAEDLIMDELFF